MTFKVFYFHHDRCSVMKDVRGAYGDMWTMETGWLICSVDSLDTLIATMTELPQSLDVFRFSGY